MKLTKRRSSPYLPVPSTLWLPDTQQPWPTGSPTISQSTTSLPSTPKTPTFASRIPFRRRGQSDGPELLRTGHSSAYRIGAEYGTPQTPRRESQLDTHTQVRNGQDNVFGNQDERYIRHRRPSYHRSISALEFVSGTGMDIEEDNGRKRDSTGQNRYPPNTLAPGSGWGFGRMRRSRKQDLKVTTPVRADSLGWREDAFAGSESLLSASPTSPTLLCPGTDRSNARTTPPITPSSPPSHAYPPDRLRTNGMPAPSAYARHLSFVVDQAEDQQLEPPPSPHSSSSLARSASLSDTVASGESSQPLMDSIRRRSVSLAIPKFRRDGSAPRKLQKRRTGSQDCNPLLLSPRHESSLRTHVLLQDLSESGRKEGQGSSSSYIAPPPSTTTTEGYDVPSSHISDDTAWTLARNSSTSTTASSMIAPSTEESTVLTPPYHAINDNRASDTWDSIGVPAVTRSRSSTVSYSSGDDDGSEGEKRRGINMMDMKQILLEGAAAELEFLPKRPAVRQQASFLSSDTIMPATSHLPTVKKTEDFSPQETGVDFTASPIHDSASPTASPAGTMNVSSPISRKRISNQFRSRASSIAAMSINRNSEYSITSIGEIGVANIGSMTPATIVHLTPIEPEPGKTQSSLSPPRPGVQRSKSEIGYPLHRALAPFLSKESLRSSPNISTPSTATIPIRPRPSPRFSLPLLDITSPENYPATGQDEAQQGNREKGAFSPTRSLSLGRLWRRISTSRRKTKSSSSNMSSSAPIPTSVSCVDVSNSNDIVDSPISTFQLPLNEIIPEVPIPVPRSSSLVAMIPGPSTISFASISTTSIDETGRKPIQPRRSSLSTPPAFMITDHSFPYLGPGSYFPRGLTGSHLPKAAEAPSTRTIIEGVTLTSTPDLTPGIDDYEVTPPRERLSPSRVARRRPENRRARFSMDGSETDPSQEERRKYRQTLVDIQDDVVFHQVLQDLARLENERVEQSRIQSDSDGEKGEELREERKPDKGEIRAWFVTRELVQGERRHGRLLARGVATVQAAAESRRDEIPPLPTPSTPDRSHSSVNLTQLPSRPSFLSRRQANSRSTASFSTSTSSSSTHLSPLSINISPKSRSRALPSQAPPSPTTSPLELLLERLPRLLALSLTLSSRFEDDPSPFGVAEAFVQMEEEMIKEIGLWAGEVGNIVAVGMGEMLDMSTGSSGRGRSRRSISGDAMTDDESQEDRLGFADIIIMPIQRAARYKLLFHEMLTITPTSTRTYNTINQALLSAEKLAAEWDRRQVFDLHSIRRQGGSQTSGKKKGQKRPRSVGVNIGRSDRMRDPRGMIEV